MALRFAKSYLALFVILIVLLFSGYNSNLIYAKEKNRLYLKRISKVAWINNDRTLIVDLF